IAERVADEQVELAVAIDVGEAQPGGVGSGVVVHRRGGAAPALAEGEAQPLGGEDGPVEGPLRVVVLAAGESRGGLGLGGGGGGGGASRGGGRGGGGCRGRG